MTVWTETLDLQHQELPWQVLTAFRDSGEHPPLFAMFTRSPKCCRIEQMKIQVASSTWISDKQHGIFLVYLKWAVGYTYTFKEHS